jgi:hypothetical protein
VLALGAFVILPQAGLAEASNGTFSFMNEWSDYDSNPVFDPETRAYYPSVLYFPDGFDVGGANYYYKVWYDQGGSTGIGYAYSSNGINWIDCGTVYPYVEGSIKPKHNFVRYDGETGPYYLYYSNDIEHPYTIDYATSSDGINWTTQGTMLEPSDYPAQGYPGCYWHEVDVLNVNVLKENIVIDETSYPYVMYYSASTHLYDDAGHEAGVYHSEAISLAYSNDGLNWTKYPGNPILTGEGVDGRLVYINCQLSGPRVLKSESEWLMIYNNHYAYVNDTWIDLPQLEYATSVDGITWAKQGNVPSIGLVGETGSWNEKRNYACSILYDADGFSGHGDATCYKMWRSGKSTDENYSIGYASALPFVVIMATVDINPDTFNVWAKGRWITAYIGEVEPYSVEDINVGTVKLVYGESEVYAQWGNFEDGSLMVKFNRSDVAELLADVEDGSDAELTVTGEVGGATFAGSDTVRVISRGK